MLSPKAAQYLTWLRHPENDGRLRVAGMMERAPCQELVHAGLAVLDEDAHTRGDSIAFAGTLRLPEEASR